MAAHAVALLVHGVQQRSQASVNGNVSVSFFVVGL